MSRAIPSAVFSQPPIGQVGLSEEQVRQLFGLLQLSIRHRFFYSQLFLQAVEQYGDVDIFTANFRPLKATLSGLPDRVFMKLVVCAKTNKVVGLHMCGEDSPEIVQVNDLLLIFFCAFSFNSTDTIFTLVIIKPFEIPGVCSCCESWLDQG